MLSICKYIGVAVMQLPFFGKLDVFKKYIFMYYLVQTVYKLQCNATLSLW